MTKTRQKIINNLNNLPFNPGAVSIVGGFFDLLHPGHAAFLKKSRGVGNPLLVYIHSDEECRKKSPDRPIFKAEDRAYMLASLSCVDWVYILEKDCSSCIHDVYRKVSPKTIIFSGGEKPSAVKRENIEIVKKMFPRTRPSANAD
jgi:cytidyltransferase-like protein